MSARRGGEHGPGSRPLGQVESAGLLLDTQPSWCSRAALTSRRGEPGGCACAQNSRAAFGSRHRPVGTCGRRGSASAQGSERLGHGGSASDFLARKRARRRGAEVRTAQPRNRAVSEESGQKGRRVCAYVSAMCAINSQHFFYFYTAASWRRVVSPYNIPLELAVITAEQSIYHYKCHTPRPASAATLSSRGSCP